MQTVISIQAKPVGPHSPMNDGNPSANMEITELLQKALQLCEEKGDQVKMAVEHIQMAIKELEQKETEEPEEDDFSPMMKQKGKGFADSLMEKSEEESKPFEE